MHSSEIVLAKRLLRQAAESFEVVSIPGGQALIACWGYDNKTTFTTLRAVEMWTTQSKTWECRYKHNVVQVAAATPVEAASRAYDDLFSGRGFLDLDRIEVTLVRN